MSGPRLVAVVAVAENGVIGRDNALPWRQSTDLKRFREITWGKPMIVGRRNWEAIGRPLPGRETVVMTRQAGYAAPGAHPAHDWEAAMALARDLAARMGADEIVVGGGAEIYRLALPELDAIRLTIVHARPDGDVLFPAYDRSAFRETARADGPAGPKDDHPVSFVDLERASPKVAGTRR